MEEIFSCDTHSKMWNDNSCQQVDHPEEVIKNKTEIKD